MHSHFINTQEEHRFVTCNALGKSGWLFLIVVSNPEYRQFKMASVRM